MCVYESRNDDFAVTVDIPRVYWRFTCILSLTDCRDSIIIHAEIAFPDDFASLVNCDDRCVGEYRAALRGRMNGNHF